MTKTVPSGGTTTPQDRLRGLLPTDRLMTVAEVAAVLAISVKTATRWVKAGKIPAVRLAGLTRVHPADLAALVRLSQVGHQCGVAQDFQSHINQHVNG